jgi:hypothetical protein
MARRKKTKKRHTVRRRRRVSGAATDAAMLVLGGLLGGVGIMWASSKWTVLSGKIAGIVELLAGGVLAWKVGNMFVKGLGVGFAVAGGYNTGKSFNIIKGIGYAKEFRNGQPMAGFRDMPKVGQPSGNGNGFPKPAGVGKADTSRMYGGVYR